jgi:hypothetical protein
MDLVAYARTAAPTAPLEWLHGFVAARVVEPVSATAERPDTIRTASGQGRSIVAGCALTA